MANSQKKATSQPATKKRAKKVLFFGELALQIYLFGVASELPF